LFQNNDINGYLLKALVDLIVFIEFSNEDDVNPDVAIQALEQLSVTLLDLSDAERKFLINRLKEISSNYRGDKSEFVENLGEALGLDL
jgi:hypothetical protein